MPIPEILFWCLVAVLLYSYVGYGAIIAMFVRAGWGRKPAGADVLKPINAPRVAFIIAAYNEEAVIASKIANTLALDHPSDRLRVYVNADGSTDATAVIASGYQNVIVLHQNDRSGKAAALNRTVESVGDADLLVFSDANTLLRPDALKLLILHFADLRVGAVSGEKKVRPGDSGKVQAVGESIYWRYESILKALDSKFHTLVGAAGELLAMRRSLYQTIPVDTILDDLHLSLGLCRNGHIVEYEPAAVAVESPSGSLAEEWERKVRIGAGAFQILSRNLRLLLPWPDVKLWFQFLSRRVLRWVACPIALPVLLFLNIILAFRTSDGSTCYSWILAIHILFYGIALLGWAMPPSRIRGGRMFQLPFYFLFMHYSLWAGLFRWMSGGQPAAWKKARRG